MAEAWPRRPLTVRMLTPSSTSAVACPWRSVRAGDGIGHARCLREHSSPRTLTAHLAGLACKRLGNSRLDVRRVDGNRTAEVEVARVEYLDECVHPGQRPCPRSTGGRIGGVA